MVYGVYEQVLGSDHRPNEWPLERLVKHYREPKVIVLLVLLASVVFACLFVIHADIRKRQQEAANNNDNAVRPPGKPVRALYVVAGSVVGNFTALFGKAFSGLLVFTFSGEDQFHDSFVVVIVLVFTVSLPLQIYLINASLAVNDMLYHIPNFYVFWNIGNIVTGAVFYDETARFRLQNWVGFLCGVGLLFLGVMCTNIAATQKQYRQQHMQSWLPVANNNTNHAQEASTAVHEEQRIGGTAPADDTEKRASTWAHARGTNGPV